MSGKQPRSMGSGKTNPSAEAGISAAFGGLDPKVIKAIIQKIPVNPGTGRVELPEIMRYMSTNPAEMSVLLSQVEKMDIGDQDTDFSNYNFQSLGPTIRKETFWVVQLEHMRMIDKAGKSVSNEKVSSMSGLRPVFMIYCYDDKGACRANQECTGLPDSKILLQTLRCAIAKPIPPLRPCLPWFLMLSIKFQNHVPDVKSFLDSLPSPFHWRVETAEEANNLRESIHEKNELGVVRSMGLAAKHKATGNAAFGKRHRAAAVAAYGEAIEHYLDALAQNPDLEQGKDAKRQLSICYANRAAALLLEGEGMDAKRALLDGQASENHDPSYAKAYIRQAKAQQVLDNLSDAQDTIARALRRPELENDHGLVDRLIELQTGVATRQHS